MITKPRQAKEPHVGVCDRCGAKEELSLTMRGSVEILRLLGWRIAKGMSQLCLGCVGRIAGLPDDWP